MRQTKLSSMIEVWLNTIIGYLVAIVSQILLFPLFDINVGLSTNLTIGLYFTVISVVRGYIVRRWFNSKIKLLSLTLSNRHDEQCESLDK